MSGEPARREAVEARRHRARALAADAVAALAAKGIVARTIGSLGRDDFREDSDVDLLVDCGWQGYPDARETCGAAFGDFPFDLVPRHDVDPEVVAAMVAEAATLIPFASVGRRVEAVRGGVVDLTETMADLDVTGLSEGGVRILANSADRTSRDLVGRLRKLLRRVILDAGGDLPADPDLAALLAAAPGGVPVVGPDTAALLGGIRFAEADEEWPTPRLDRTAALRQGLACKEAAEAVLADVEAFVAARRAGTEPHGPASGTMPGPCRDP